MNVRSLKNSWSSLHGSAGCCYKQAHAYRARGGDPTRRSTLVASVREPKNPKDFGSMDEMREHLHKSKGWSMSGLLNWLSNNSFGYASQGLLSSVLRPSKQSQSQDRELGVAVEQGKLDQVMLLLLCSEQRARKLLGSHPEVAGMSTGELMQRLVGLKSALPGLDVSRLVEMQPRLFLCGNRLETERQVRECAAALRQGLPGADVDAMLAEDPGLLFVDVTPGIQQLHSLWEVDAAALANSKPDELALAVRALANALPSKWV